jgi:hypothetical protein
VFVPVVVLRLFRPCWDFALISSLYNRREAKARIGRSRKKIRKDNNSKDTLAGKDVAASAVAGCCPWHI